MAFEVSLPARGTTVRTTLGESAPEGAALLVPVANGEDARTRAIAFWMREAAMSSIAFVIFLVV